MAFIAIFFSRLNCHIFVGLHCQLILPEIMSEMTKADTSFNPIHAENPTLQITTSKLDGMNFMEWSQFVKISLKSKGKFKYASEAPPNVKDPKFETWDTENYMVMSWLLNSMEPRIKKTYVLLPTTKEI